MIKKILKLIILTYYNIIYYIMPIDKDTIIFESSVGNNYSGNPRAVYEEMVKCGLDKRYKCVWVLKNTNAFIPGKNKKVKRLYLKYFYYMAVSKYWICDSRQPIYLKKKKGNIYIQTWHGTPLKKIGLDMNFVNMATDKDIKIYGENFKIDSSKWDYLISQNEYSSNIFRRCFAFDKIMLEIGYPRNDILFSQDNNLIEEVRKKLNIDNTKKVILYAPTWRDNKYKKDGTYEFTIPIDLNEFVKRFSDKYILLLKPHYLVCDKIDVSKYNQSVKMCTNECDIQELYLISDILITDYSSVMFDYSILKRPIIFYIYDFNEYKSQARELYFDMFSEIPGPVVKNNYELFSVIENIKNISNDFEEKYKQFCNKYNRIDNGNASKKIIDIMVRHNK